MQDDNKPAFNVRFGRITSEDFLDRFFRIALIRFAALPETKAKEQATTHIQAQLSLDPKMADWSDLFAVEVAVIQASDKDDLRLLAEQIYDRYKSIVGVPMQTLASLIGVSAVPGMGTTPTEPEQITRDNLINALTDIYYSYSLTREKEANRSTALLKVGLWTLFLFLAGILFLIYRGSEATWKFPALISVAWAGALGGLTSLLWRLAQVPIRDDKSTLVVEVRQALRTAQLTSPVIGAVFAFVLYMAICSGVVNGMIFPNMMPASEMPAAKPPPETKPVVSVNPSTIVPEVRANNDSKPLLKKSDSSDTSSDTKDGPNFAQILAGMTPADGQNLSLLLLWGFIAGFFEKFVPDTLDRLTKRGEKKG